MSSAMASGDFRGDRTYPRNTGRAWVRASGRQGATGNSVIFKYTLKRGRDAKGLSWLSKVRVCFGYESILVFGTVQVF